MEEDNNIYLMDKPINDITKDEFDHKSIVDEIVNNIKVNNAPYNIALIGKWGTGKSSILDCVKEQLIKEEKGKYLFTTINAWKYEKQEIRKSFILDIIDKIPGTDTKSKRILDEVVELLNNSLMINIKERQNNKENWFVKGIKIFFSIVLKSLVTILPLVLMFLFAYFIIDKALNIAEKSIDDYNSIRLTQIGAFIITIVGEFATIIKNTVYAKKPISINIKENEKDSNFYEEQLETAINLYKSRKENKDFKSIICVVEDIDRLNANKMVEAICALKSFIGIENLIFIVPYDTSILSRVLEECRNNKLSTNYEILEGELILNKLFQFKVYMPELIQEDMYEYAKNLIENENRSIYKLFPNKDILLDDVLPILMYEGVTTPREVKQLVNAFIVKYKMALSREIIKVNNFDKNCIQLLAVLTVLECDFNEFYSKITHYPNLINEFLKIAEEGKSEDNIKIIYKQMKRLYKETKFNELITFLKYTAIIEIKNIERLIYLNDSKIDKVAGGKDAKDFREALRNAKHKDAIELLKNIPEISDIVAREINCNKGNYLRSKNIIITIIKIYSHISSVNEKEKIRNIIEQNINRIDKIQYSNLELIDLIEIIKEDILSVCKNIKEVFLTKIQYWRPVYYFEEEYDEKDYLEKELEKLISIYENVTDDIKEKITELFGKIGNYTLTDKDADEQLKEYDFVDFYNYIKDKLNAKNYRIFGEKFLLSMIGSIKKKKIELEELELIKNIYQEDNNIDTFVEITVDEIADEEVTKVIKLLRILEDSIKVLSKENKGKIFILIDTNKVNISKVKGEKLRFLDNVIRDIILDIIKEDENNNIDPLLKTINEITYIDNTIVILANNNYLEKIPNTIIQINQEIVDGDECYLEMLKKIHRKYSEEYKKELFDKLLKNLPNYKENIKSLKDVFNILNIISNKSICIEFFEEVVDYLENKYNTIEKLKRKDMIVFSVENIKLLKQDKINEFFKFINDKIFALEPILAVESSKHENFNNVDEEVWENVIEKYIKSAKIEILDFVDIINKKINILNGNNEIKEKYIEKIINNFTYDVRILKTLANLSINDIETIVNIYEVLTQYNESDVVQCMNQIVEKIQNVDLLIEKILENGINLELIIKLISSTSKNKLENSIKNLLEKYTEEGNYNQEVKIGLLELISRAYNGKRIFKEKFIALSIGILNKLEVEDAEKVTNLIVNNNKIIDKESRKIILNKLEVTIERMTENEKKEIKLLLNNF